MGTTLYSRGRYQGIHHNDENVEKAAPPQPGEMCALHGEGGAPTLKHYNQLGVVTLHACCFWNGAQN